MKIDRLIPIGFVCLFIFILGFGFFMFLLKPSQRLWDQSSYFRKLKQGQNNDQPIVESVNLFELNEMKDELNEKKSILIENENFNVFLRQFIQSAENESLNIVLVMPMPTIKNHFYTERPVKIELMGNFQAILAFMQKTSSSFPLFSWGDWALSILNNGRKSELYNSNNILHMKTTAIFYCTNP